MPFFRTIISLIYVGLFMLASLILLPIEYFIRKKNPAKALKFSHSVVIAGFKALTLLAGSTPRIYGKENIPRGEPVIFMGNHRSYYDLIISYVYLPHHTAIFSKSELRSVPVIGAWMKRLKCLFLERDNMRQNMEQIISGIKLVENGSNILIFPEGKRNKEAGVCDFHAGSFKLATKPGVKIVPVVQTNTREIFENQFPWLKAQKTTLEFLPPVDPAKLSKDELKKIHIFVHDMILEKYEQNNLK